MPYTIRTKDGIEIPDVPDNIAADSPEARALVQAARAKRQGGSRPVQPGSPTAAALTHRRPVEPMRDRPYTPDEQQGANLPRGVRGALTAGQGLTFGLLDELAGAAGVMGQAGAYAGAGYANQPAPTVRPDEVYAPLRDVVRGGVEQFRRESPGVSMLTEAAGGLPFMAVGSTPAMTAGQRIAQGLRTGATAGGITGIGSSEAQTPGGVLEDALFGAVSGGVTGSAMPAVTGVVGGGARRVAAASGSQASAEKLARERLAMLLNRNLPYQFQDEGRGRFLPRIESRLRSLGENAPLAATGPETIAELDTLANMPGSTRQALNVTRRDIQARRGPALVSSAESVLEARGKPFNQTLDGFVTAKQEAARPHYAALESATVTVDDDIIRLLNRAKNALGGAQELARVAGTELPDLTKLSPGDTLPFTVLDTVKRSLWDIAEGAKGEFGKATERSRAYNGLRRELIEKLDAASPVDASGRSIYRTARETFESGAQVETAMRRGADAMGEKVDDLRSVVEGMDGPELEAFQLGAAQALRDKLGTQAGQTQILNLYKEPTMKAKLQIIFGNDFNKFRRAVLQQEQLKEVERAGRGSQTFGREAQAADMGQFMEALDTAQAAKSGNLVETVKRGAGRLAMPEPVRNELSRMMLKRGFEGRMEARQAQELADALARARTRRARGLGGAAGATTSSQLGE